MKRRAVRLRSALAGPALVLLTVACGSSAPTASTADPDRGTSAARTATTATTTAEAIDPRQRYGEGPLQIATLLLPPGEGPHRVVVLVHGGFWRSPYRANLMNPLADDLVARGVAVWNIEYRSVGDSGGGYPGTLEDVAAAMDHLAEIDGPLDLAHVTVIGHSAGGHLALWLAGRERLAAEDPGGEPVVVPSTVVALAAVADLEVAAAEGLGRNAVQDLLGGSPELVAERYAIADPDPGTARVIAVHGGADRLVPPSQSQLLEGAELLTDPDADHFDVIDPTHPLWRATLDALAIE